MLKNLHWLGHAAFRWDGSKIVYFDPWKIPASSKKADIVLISHEHFDHFSMSDLKRIVSNKTIIVSNQTVADKIRAFGLQCDDVKSMRPGDSAELDGIKITAVASYNIGKSFHPKTDRKLGFLVSMDALTVYHAGDTDIIPEMKGLKCDIALLPIGGTYTMDTGEAAEAVMAIKPKIAIPMHFGDIVGSTQDGEKFKELVNGKVDVSVLTKES